MTRITAGNLASWINQLDKAVEYNYINPKNTGLISIERVDLPEGPVFIKRWDPNKRETESTAKRSSISSNMLWRVANAIQDEMPINIDRIVGASYNTRSALESLLAYTPYFYITYPGRIEIINSSSEIMKGHKHIIMRQEQPHRQGRLEKYDTEKVISEIPSQQAVYESLTLPDYDGSASLDIEQSRRHAQIQIAIVLIGMQLGYRTWIAKNDRGIVYNKQKISEMQSVVPSLNGEQLMSSFQDAAKSAELIDCIWFKNHKLMPAVMEVEYTTGITSGLCRMKTFHDKFPPFPTRYVIIAPDEDRGKFLQEGSKDQFASLEPRFFPFSAVEELYSLCQRRHPKGVTDDFLDCFMEKVS